MEPNLDSPLEIHRMFQSDFVKFNKKRKSLGKQLDLPVSKHRFRDKSSVLEQIPQYVGDLEPANFLNMHMKMTQNIGKEDTRLEQHDPTMSSTATTSLGESVCAMFQYAEAQSEQQFLKAYNYGHQARSEPNSPKAHAYHRPSTSSGSCGSNSPKNTCYLLSNSSVDNDIMKEESPQSNGHHAVSEDRADYRGPDFGTTETEEYIDDDLKDMMLYSNGVSSDAFVLSSGRWNTNPDAPQRPRQPTIDQEFEQYFSMLML